MLSGSVVPISTVFGRIKKKKREHDAESPVLKNF